MKNSFLFIIIFFSISMFSGCFSVIGFGVGTAVDNNRSGEHFTLNEELFDISPGTEIELITIYHDTIVGYYQNSTNEYANDYIEEYKSKYEEISTQITIPNIDDTLFIANPKEEIYKYIFLGFDYNKMFVKSVLSKQDRFMKFNPEIKIKLISGQYLNYHIINDGIEFKLIPIMSKMNLENKTGSQSVFYHNIHKILAKSSNRARYLTVIGLSIDLFLWYNLEDSWGFGGGKMWKWE